MALKLTIIGSGSAVPTLYRGVTSQYLNFNERRFLIDCGEGTQLQLRKYRVKFQRLQAIFISHLHGDHYLGLVGLLSSMSLLGRIKELTVYGPAELEEMLRFQFKVAAVHFNYELKFVHLKKNTSEVLFEDNLIEIKSFPVKHRIDCWGFRFDEKPKEKNVNASKIKELQLSLEEILKLKKGEDVVRESEYHRNEDLTLKDAKLVSYAYSADTTYFEKMAEYVKGVDLLYHEATFIEKHADRAKATKHSTAIQAATIAKDAEVGQLLLGHFSARYKDTSEIESEAKSIFSNTICVSDGDEFNL
ncbi:MAG: ribonuclease Z [Arenicella sp.]|jgi:ribonuclease Z